MSQFIQLHLLTSYPPSNPNRDDLGRPKTAVMGGTTRMRISSQGLKSAWRKSDAFGEALKGNKAIRTKLMGVEIYNKLLQSGITEKKAKDWAKKMAGVFGKNKSENKDKPLEELEIDQITVISPEETTAIDNLCQVLIKEQRDPNENELSLLREENSSADVAMFGRMLASNPKFNVEAAVQVAHAITVHKVAVEDDFFTAVDDLNRGEIDRGSAHMGDTEFSSGLFYLYICINKTLLIENLGGNKDLANKTLAALVEASATVAPSGKQNSFGNRVRASYILAEKGPQQPRSLSLAFLKAVTGEDVYGNAKKEMKAVKVNMVKSYGECSEGETEMDALAGTGTLAEIKKFVREA